MQKEAKQYAKCHHAFTLVELILVVGTIALVAGALVGLVGNSFKDFKLGSNRSTLLQDGQAVIEQMVRILRQAKGFSAVSQSTDQAGDITFTSVDEISEQFKLNTLTDELEYGQPGSLSALTGSVSSLVFTCYDINGDALTGAVPVSSIQSVHIETTLTDTENSFTLTGRAFCSTDFSCSSDGPTYQEFTEAKASFDVQSITIPTPTGTSEGDLLIAAVVTDASEMLSPPGGEGWTEIDQGIWQNQVTLGVWWKLAGASESSSHQFTWGSSEQCYAFMMRFTDHDSTDPINDSLGQGASTDSSPPCQAVTTTVANCLILRIGGFDDDDITVNNPGLSGHTVITMDESNSGSHTCSGGAGYVLQQAIGSSGISNFSLTAGEQSRTVTIAIAPAP